MRRVPRDIVGELGRKRESCFQWLEQVWLPTDGVYKGVALQEKCRRWRKEGMMKTKINKIHVDDACRMNFCKISISSFFAQNYAKIKYFVHFNTNVVSNHGNCRLLFPHSRYGRTR